MQRNLIIQAVIYSSKCLLITYSVEVKEKEINVSVSFLGQYVVGNRKVNERLFLYFKKLKIYLKG